MLRIYLSNTHSVNNQISITGDKARYLASVLRCKEGDALVIFDGAGNCFKTTISKAGKKEVIADVLEKFPCNPESPVNITLVQSLLKGEKMDLVIQKTTELGVREIVPVVTERSQLRETRKVIRWQKIAEEASRQSGRTVIPVVHEPVSFQDIFTGNDLKGFIFYEEGSERFSDAVSSFIPHPSSLFIVIGPEGGFTKEEVELAKEKGLVAASLGKRILRAETAAIAAVTLAQYALGDMG
ncbi:MAG: 16S rRNA (uracil(1498)-N(3))-methyltransferase [Thermodesulfovibrionales bacterium]